jgi:large subunit ribosomal protein L13
VVVNVVDPLVTGGRVRNKVVRYHTGYVGHLREMSYAQVLRSRPRLLYEWALLKMMPKNQLSRQYLSNLLTF